jgi:hypothetical protein
MGIAGTLLVWAQRPYVSLAGASGISMRRVEFCATLAD